MSGNNLRVSVEVLGTCPRVTGLPVLILAALVIGEPKVESGNEVGDGEAIGMDRAPGDIGVRCCCGILEDVSKDMEQSNRRGLRMRWYLIQESISLY
jgi:hypothetical protein